MGVDTVFGIVGHSNLGFGDAIRQAELRGELSYFGVRHEGAAAFAASAYGKLMKRPAACFGIAGPGSTNPKIEHGTETQTAPSVRKAHLERYRAYSSVTADRAGASSGWLELPVPGWMV